MEVLAFIGFVLVVSFFFRISGIESVEWGGFRIVASGKPATLSSKAKPRRSLQDTE
jgi:hypothetical protein